MPDEFTPEEKKMLAEAPADSATFIGDDATDDEAGEQARPNAEDEPPAGAQA